MPLPSNSKLAHEKLDERVERQEPAAIASAIIRSLNADNGVNYPYSKEQHELLTDTVQKLQKAGVKFSEKMIDDLASAADQQLPVPDSLLWIQLDNVLEDIFRGDNWNGQRLPERPQPYHFDSYPYPHE